MPHGIHENDWPDFVDMLRDYRQFGREFFARMRGDQPTTRAEGTNTREVLAILLADLKPGRTVKAAPLRKVIGDWTDVCIVGNIDDAEGVDQPTFQLEFPASGIRSNPIPIDATAAEFREIIQQSPSPWAATVNDVQLGAFNGKPLYRWRVNCKPESTANTQEHQQQPDRTFKAAITTNAGNLDVRAVTQRCQWIPTGELIEIASAIPSTEPSAMRKGATVVASLVGNSGYVVTACEIRSFSVSTDVQYPYDY
ncbi:MAG: hypothetical protein KDA71_09770 [Planctomycetales bacterium]|nr:hypothetical protein [Planctomycetales bacterium]